MRMLASLRAQIAIVGILFVCNGPVDSFHVQLPKNELHSSVWPLHATWSDSRAVMDYQNFLASGKQEIELKADRASVIIRPLNGDCSLAEALYGMGMGDDIVLTPDQELPQLVDGAEEYPIYITLPPYQLEDFLKNLLPSYKAVNDNFVFFSGGLMCGNIEDLLKDRGMSSSLDL